MPQILRLTLMSGCNPLKSLVGDDGIEPHSLLRMLFNNGGGLLTDKPPYLADIQFKENGG